MGSEYCSSAESIKGRVYSFASIHSSPTLTPVSSRREVHAHQRNPRGRPTLVQRWQRAQKRNPQGRQPSPILVKIGFPLVYSSFHKLGFTLSPNFTLSHHNTSLPMNPFHPLPISLPSQPNTSIPLNPFHASSNFTCWTICLIQVSFYYFVAFFSVELLESNPTCSALLLISVLKWPIEVKSLIC